MRIINVELKKNYGDKVKYDIVILEVLEQIYSEPGMSVQQPKKIAIGFTGNEIVDDFQNLVIGFWDEKEKRIYF